MGCHTWFYVHLPEKAKEMENHFIDKMKASVKDSYLILASIDPIWFSNYPIYNNSQIEYYTTHTLEDIVSEYPDEDIEDLKVNKVLCEFHSKKEYDKIKQLLIDKYKKIKS